MWIALVICSAIFLGVYDILKKTSVTHNAVFPVMFFSSLTALLLFAPLMIISYYSPQTVQSSIWYIPFSGIHTHMYIFIKSLIVQSSWICAFFAMKHLPISIVSPIRSSGPMWTLLGAVFILNEQLNTYQWVGVIIILGCLYAFSNNGKKEGIHFTNNIWVFLIFAGTLLGSASALYDKYLIHELHIHKMELQAWFSVYQFLLTVIILIIWMPHKHKTHTFTWRWSIPFIGIFLVLADFFYFYALSSPDSLISVVSIIRRSGVIISFLSGVYIFKEQNLKSKAFLLIGILIGIAILYLSK